MGSQQTMEEVFASLAPNGQAPCLICPRTEATLHAVANRDVFNLDSMTHLDALTDVRQLVFGRIAEIKIEDDFAAVHVKGNHEVRIKIAFIPVEHEVGILPEVVGAI